MRSHRKRARRTGQYKSKLEALVASLLPPKNAFYESASLQYILYKKYIPDFTIVTSSGHVVYLEVKGYLRYEDQVKMRAVKETNPELDIRFFFSKDGKVQSSKLTNSEWCKKYNFPYAIGKIPKKWFR